MCFISSLLWLKRIHLLLKWSFFKSSPPNLYNLEQWCLATQRLPPSPVSEASEIVICWTKNLCYFVFDRLSKSRECSRWSFYHGAQELPCRLCNVKTCMWINTVWLILPKGKGNGNWSFRLYFLEALLQFILTLTLKREPIMHPFRVEGSWSF